MREREPIGTTLALSRIVCDAVPAKYRNDGHPAKRTFQAVRIEVNGELSSLAASIEALADRLSPGGRIAVISFHSLEDRIVKNTFATLANPCICPRDFPVCVCGRKAGLEDSNEKAAYADRRGERKKQPLAQRQAARCRKDITEKRWRTEIFRKKKTKSDVNCRIIRKQGRKALFPSEWRVPRRRKRA